MVSHSSMFSSLGAKGMAAMEQRGARPSVHKATPQGASWPWLSFSF
jgi:hypothetical protein